jgi:transposase
MDLPVEFGSWKGAHNRLRKWAANGAWAKVFTALLAQADAKSDPDWIAAVELHDRARAPARHRSPSKGAPAGEPHDHAIERSRGGLTTKIHLAADSRCRPLVFALTPGQAGDAPAFTQVMDRRRAPRPVGRPRTTPEVVPADKAYSSCAFRAHLRRPGICAVIPQPADQVAHRKRHGSHGGRPRRLRPRALETAQHRRTLHQ